MQFRTGFVFLAAGGLLFACGPRPIRKMPVPQEDIIQSYRLMGEGDEHLRAGEFHLALSRYVQASALNPYHEVIFNKLGVTYARLHLYFQAEKAVDRAIGLNREYPYAYNTKGIIKLARQDYGAAEAEFGRAIRLRSDVANFHVNMGYALMQRRKFQDAVESFQAGLKLDPDIFQSPNLFELGVDASVPGEPEKFYEMARQFALSGLKNLSLAYLQRALQTGFSDFARLRGDQAFDAYREDPRFLEIVNQPGHPSQPEN